MALADYDIIFQTRTPNATGGVAPTLAEIGHVFAKTNLSWARELWFDGGDMNFSLDPDGIPDAIKTCLLDPFNSPCEVKMYKGSTLLQQGPLISAQVQGPTVTCQVRGLMYYTRYMHVISDLTYTGVDQYTIVAGLIDHHQDQTYGHYGIDASGVGASGTTVNRSYKKNRIHNIFNLIDKLAQRQNGFDYYVTFDEARDLTLVSKRGTDKSATVILDSRGIFSPQISMSAAQRNVGSEALAVGHSFDDDPYYSSKTDATALANFGRAQITEHFDNIGTQTDIDEIAQALLDANKEARFNPGAMVMIPVTGADPITDYDVGDTVTWSFDAGLGLQTVAKDINRLQVSIDQEGEEKVTVDYI